MRSDLSWDVPCLTRLPCSSGKAHFLLALVSQRAGIPLDSNGKACDVAAYRYEIAFPPCFLLGVIVLSFSIGLMIVIFFAFDNLVSKM